MLAVPLRAQPSCPGGGCSGDDAFYGARVLAVIFGSLVAVLVGNLVLPWFTSDWALDTMGGALQASVAMAQAAYEQYCRWVGALALHTVMGAGAAVQQYCYS